MTTTLGAANHESQVEAPKANPFPATWNGRTFTDAMIGHPLPMLYFFNMDKAFELVDDIAGYARHDFDAPPHAQTRLKQHRFFNKSKSR